MLGTTEPPHREIHLGIGCMPVVVSNPRGRTPTGASTERSSNPRFSIDTICAFTYVLVGVVKLHLWCKACGQLGAGRADMAGRFNLGGARPWVRIPLGDPFSSGIGQSQLLGRVTKDGNISVKSAQKSVRIRPRQLKSVASAPQNQPQWQMITLKNAHTPLL